MYLEFDLISKTRRNRKQEVSRSTEEFSSGHSYSGFIDVWSVFAGELIFKTYALRLQIQQGFRKQCSI